ncbi:MAG: CBU_0585 family protein [Pseudomonadota bacterium]
MPFKKLINKILGKHSAKPYVSEADEFLHDFDKTHTRSDSQAREIEKHERIAKSRDNPIKQQKDSKIWQDF